MAKRKCTRPAIVELSDSEDDEGADDCVIVNTDRVTARNKETSCTAAITSNLANLEGRRSTQKRTTRTGESHETFVNKKGKSRKFETNNVTKAVKKEAVVIRDRRRKRSELTEKKMGSNNSTTRESEARRLREDVRLHRARAERAEDELRRAKIEEHHRQQKLLEDAKLKEARDAWQRQQQLQQQQLQQQQLQQQQLHQQQLQQQFHQQWPQVPAAQPFIRPAASAPAKAAVNLKPQAVETKTVLPGSKPKVTDTPASNVTRLADSKVQCIEWTDIEYVQEKHKISRYVAENIIRLFKEDNTIPFIARYRKNMTLGMEADELRNVKASYDRAALIKQKANVIIKEIDKQGKWTAELHAFVQGTKSLNDLEQIHSMFKVTKATLAERAREIGLGVPAQVIMNAGRMDSVNYLIKPTIEGLKTDGQVRDGIVCILSDMINKDESTFQTIKKLRSEHSSFIQTTKVKAKEDNKEKKDQKTNKQKNDENKYDLYHNFSSAENNLKPHQILAINRGEARKILTVKVDIPAQFENAFKAYCAKQYGRACNASSLHRTLLTAAFDQVWNKSIKSSVARRTRHELNERAEIASMDVFAENVKQLLLTPPVRGKVVVGVDPGFHHGCKLAVVSEQGDVLETATIYPHDNNNPIRRNEAARTLAGLVLVHKCTIFALGNGTACRETEVFLVDLIKKGTFDPINVVYTIVDETGASIYSCSREATVEFPNLDVNVISAVSIARRLQDPMAELVKIEPKHLGVGMYQHDLPAKQLATKLNEVIMEAVSFVGVDVNTASVSLLIRVAGLGETRAKNIIEWRKESGPFRTRKDLTKVPRIGPKTFEQCAGFIRIMPETAVANDRHKDQAPHDYLDQTWIHPESYDVARAFVKATNCNPADLGTKSFIFGVQLFARTSHDQLAKKFSTTVDTIAIIVKGLSMEKGQDIRARADVSMFRKSLKTLDDLKIGTVLTGVVRNVTHFGAFVDVGVEETGLIHKSKMSGTTLSVGQRVETSVNNIQKERRRLGLTLIKCV